MLSTYCSSGLGSLLSTWYGSKLGAPQSFVHWSSCEPQACPLSVIVTYDTPVINHWCRCSFLQSMLHWIHCCCCCCHVCCVPHGWNDAKSASLKLSELTLTESSLQHSHGPYVTTFCQVSHDSLLAIQFSSLTSASHLKTTFCMTPVYVVYVPFLWDGKLADNLPWLQAWCSLIVCLFF